jgi:hypothetical protein
MLDVPKQKVERVSQNNAGIIQKDGNFFATLDGIQIIPIEKELAQNIAIALRVQDKVDEALITGNRIGFLKTIQMLNCRKTISAVRGTRPIQSLTNRKELERTRKLPVQEWWVKMQEITGAKETLEDVDRILKSGKAPVIGSNESLQVKESLDRNPADLPAVVHVFDVPPDNLDGVVSQLAQGPGSFSTEDFEGKLGFNHTFLVLGKDSDGKYACFQKRGPEIREPFEILELDAAVTAAVIPAESGTHLSVIGRLL